MLSFSKKLFCVLIISFFVGNEKGFCQNLVPNPSFENYTFCPHSVGEVYKCSNWSSFGNTSDYFNACDTLIVSVPNNLFGSQLSHIGDGYCGFYNFGANNYREFIGAKLLDSLTINVTYYVSAWVSLADKKQYGCSSNNVGFLFSNERYYDSIPAPVNNFSHFHENSIISDSINYQIIKGSFIADSNYKYLIIGNFYDNFNTDTLNCPPSYTSYFYVDNICVSIDSNNCYSTNAIKLEKNISVLIYPNPTTGELYILNKTLNLISQIVITNNIGQLIDFNYEINNGKYKVVFSNIESGIYYLTVFFKNQSRINKLFIKY